MCGIYGITDKDPNFIQQYIDTCTHRGPDGSKIKTIQGITLGHNLLSIMANPTMSTQPWDTPAGNTLIYNGEIFNYHELKEKYNNEFTDTTGCDTELLAWGLDKYGLDFLDEIDSMHGFAYYRHKEAQLIISRDHVGIKPLYYAEIESGIVFGSELKGLLDKVPGSRKLDRLAASLQSRAGCNPSRNTLFSNIKQLLPGETLVYSVPDRKFIDDKRIYIVPHGNKTFKPKEFRQQVSDAVKRCAIGQRKIGVFLSGGLDSSMVAYELGRLQKVNTFTNRMYPEVKSPEDYNSDANAAKVLADREGYTHHEVLITPKEYMSAWEQSIDFMEQTNFNPSMAMYFHTNKFMADKGIVVTMAGDMGDELLGGYPKYQKMFFGKHPTSWRELLTMWLGRMKRPKKITQDIMPDELLLDELEKCFSDKLWNPEDPVGSYMALDCVTQCPAEFFSRNDTYGMAHSMEGRFPLASKKFMQYCLDIHTRYKLTGSETKIISRTAYTGILPKEIVNKTKTGWTVPVGFWLTEKMDRDLELFYCKSLGRERLNIVTTSQKSAKMLIPDLIYKDWQKTYRVQDA